MCVYFQGLCSNTLATEDCVTHVGLFTLSVTIVCIPMTRLKVRRRFNWRAFFTHKLTISTNCAILRYRKHYTRERQRTADVKTVRNIWWIYAPCKPNSEAPSWLSDGAGSLSNTLGSSQANASATNRWLIGDTAHVWCIQEYAYTFQIIYRKLLCILSYYFNTISF